MCTEVFLVVGEVKTALSSEHAFQTTPCHILAMWWVMSHLPSLQACLPFLKCLARVRMEDVNCRQPAEIVCYTLDGYLRNAKCITNIKTDRVHIKNVGFWCPLRKWRDLQQDIYTPKWQQLDRTDRQLLHFAWSCAGFQFAAVPTTPYCDIWPSVILSHLFWFLCYSF